MRFPGVAGMAVSVALLPFGAVNASAEIYTGSASYAPPTGTPSLNGPTPDPAQTEEYLRTLGATYDDQSGTVTIRFSLYDPTTWGPILKDGDGGSGSGGTPLFWPFQFTIGYLGDQQHPVSAGYPTYCNTNGQPGVNQPDLGGPVLGGNIVSTFSDADNDGDDDGTSTANDSDGDGTFTGDFMNNVSLEGYSGSLSAPVSFDGNTFTATIENQKFEGQVWDCLVINDMIELPLSPPAPPSPLPTLLNPWSEKFSVRPAIIGLSGDGSSFLGGLNGHGKHTARNWPRWAGHIVWSSWTRTQAVGSGVNWLDNCKPACSTGKEIPHPAKVQAFDPQNGHFTRLRTAIKYEGRWRMHTWTLSHSRNGWYW
jgi:hypothetical protein